MFKPDLFSQQIRQEVWLAQGRHFGPGRQQTAGVRQ
jgi:hypothetical protein